MAIKIAGEVEKSFMNSTKLTKKELQSIARTAAKTSTDVKYTFSGGVDKLNGTFDAMSAGAKKAFDATAKAATLAAATIAGIATASIAVGSGFESAFAGVKKTVDATDAQLDELEQSIRDIAKNMPMTAEEIAGIAEAAGQLGIETENIASFTKTMADLGVATNLTSEEAATQFARFANITGMSQDNFDRLGSSVVALGNNLATTESEITNMAMRLAGAGSQVNMSESQILGFAAALSSVGIEAEAGGSAFSKVMVNMQLATETGKNGLKDYAKVAGMTSSEFQKAFKEDAAGAITSFINGLNNVERNGMSAISVLDSMGISEVRLRDALLRASNAGDLFTDSIDIANGAWEENTALTNEAAQRYATFESKLDMFKNTMKDFGISIYQDMREPLADGLDAATQFVSTLAGKVDSKNMIGDLIKSFTTKLPTAIRKVKEFTAAFLNFVDPFLKLGKWLIQNPDVVVSAIAGIGAAIATYKVAQGVNSLVKGFTSLAGILTNPFAAALLAVGVAIGGAVSIATYISKANKEMKKQNLAEHFGNISLSLEDLKEVAGHIVQTDNLGKIREALSAMDDMDEIANSIGDAVESLNKMNWKVGIGMELSESEKQEYQDNIVSYIADVQELVTQKQYAVTLAVGVLMGDDGLEESNVITQINEFYANKQQELADLGTKLNEVVTEAFQDGLLDVDEVKEITELQSQMAKIQSAVAGSQFDAQLELLNLKYSGGELDAESFQNLQAEISKQVQEAIADYDESLTLGIANAKVMFDDGALDKAGYDKMVQELKEGYLEQIGDIELKATNFQLDTIMTQYSDELGAVMPEFEKAVEEALQNSTDYINSGLDNMALNWTVLFDDVEGFKKLDKTTRKALEDLFTQMQPSVESLNELKAKYKEYGMEVPASINEGINDAAVLGALTRDYDSIWTVLGNAAADSEEHTKAIEKVRENGWYVPEELASAIEENKKAVEAPIAGMYAYSEEYMKQIFGQGLSLDVPITLNPLYNMTKGNGLPTFINPRTALGGHADGGIFDTPHVAWFAEEGPEAAIPLDGSKNAIDLWQLTGRLLGIRGVGENKSDETDSFTQLYNDISGDKSTSTSEPDDDSKGYGQITYSPVLQFYGDSPSKEELDSALETSQEKFDAMMKQWMKDNDRFSFA